MAALPLLRTHRPCGCMSGRGRVGCAWGAHSEVGGCGAWRTGRLAPGCIRRGAWACQMQGSRSARAGLLF